MFSCSIFLIALRFLIVSDLSLFRHSVRFVLFCSFLPSISLPTVLSLFSHLSSVYLSFCCIFSLFFILSIPSMSFSWTAHLTERRTASRRSWFRYLAQTVTFFAVKHAIYFKRRLKCLIIVNSFLKLNHSQRALRSIAQTVLAVLVASALSIIFVARVRSCTCAALKFSWPPSQLGGYSRELDRRNATINFIMIEFLDKLI